MEVFMSYNCFDVGIVIICRSFWICQNVLSVKHIETFVLHGPHVEIVNRDNVEQV